MLRIDAPVRDDLIAHARSGAPEEVCGVLGGTREAPGPHDAESDCANPQDRVRVSRQVANAAASPRTRYEMAPTALLEAVETVEDAGDDVVGFYHSHPRGPAEPSATDRDRATWDGYCYVIVARADGSVDDSTTDLADGSADDPADEWLVRAWRWDGSDGRFREEPIVTE